ncbi:hypothetical protein TNCV_1646341 [Trichonephila clavipes]|nr:hypothetical protein TNCV_1646341 [Trichonephila clavipes]
MKEDRCSKKIFLAKPMGNGSRSRTPLRWIDCVEKVLNVLKVKNWRTVAKSRDARRKLLEKKEFVHSPKTSLGMGPGPRPPLGALSRPRLNLKIIIRIISTAKCYFWLYSPPNWEFRTICQLATGDDRRPRIAYHHTPSYAVKRRQSIEPVCAIEGFSRNSLPFAVWKVFPLSNTYGPALSWTGKRKERMEAWHVLSVPKLKADLLQCPNYSTGKLLSLSQDLWYVGNRHGLSPALDVTDVPTLSLVLPVVTLSVTRSRKTRFSQPL